MAIVNKRWPADLAPETCTFSRSRNDILQRSPRSRQTSVIVQGRALWGCRLSWSLPNGATLAKLRRWLERLEGFKGSVQLWDFTSPRPEGFAPPAHWAAGATCTVGAAASAGARIVVLSGLTPSVIAVVAGQYVQIGRRLYLAADDATATGGGTCVVHLETPLIESVPHGETVRLAEAGCEMHLVVQDIDTTSRAGDGLVTVSASFSETVVDFDEPEGTWLDFIKQRVTIDGVQDDPPEDFLTVTRASEASYCDSAGVLQYAAAGELRYTHDPETLAPLGAWSEAAATNLAIYSDDATEEDFLNNATVSEDSAAAPDGTMAADTIVEDNAAATIHGTASSASVTANTVYCLSRWFKAAGRARGRLSWDTGILTSGVYVAFDLSAGTVDAPVALGTGTAAGAGIEAWPNGWFRVWVAGKLDAATTTGFYLLYMADGAGGINYTGDETSGMYVWGTQLEVGDRPSSYVPTTSGSATRNADAISVATSAFPFDATQGALFAEFSIDRVEAAAFPNVAGVNDGTTDNRAVIYITNANATAGFVAAGGAEQANLGGDDPAAGAVRKAAIAWRANDVAFVDGETALQADASASVPAVTTLTLGASLDGYLRRVGIIPRRVPNADLEELVA